MGELIGIIAAILIMAFVIIGPFLIPPESMPDYDPTGQGGVDNDD